MVIWNNSASGIDGETNKYRPKSVRWVEIQRHDSGIMRPSVFY